MVDLLLYSLEKRRRQCSGGTRAHEIVFFFFSFLFVYGWRVLEVMAGEVRGF